MMEAISELGVTFNAYGHSREQIAVRFNEIKLTQLQQTPGSISTEVLFKYRLEFLRRHDFVLVTKWTNLFQDYSHFTERRTRDATENRFYGTWNRKRL